jgi:tRNA dimethylallyltransferase
MYGNQNARKAIVVCGPTASGKTALGAALARSCGGEILSADSRQVYRGLDIGTGKDLELLQQGGHGVPCHLIDIADPREVYTLYRFVDDCYAAFRAVCARGRVPVIVGGSGLYLEAVLKNYRIAEAPEDAALMAALMAREKSELAAELRGLSEDIFQHTDTSSKKRIARAIQVALHARANPSVRRAGANPPAMHALVLGLSWQRDTLRERIRQRLHQRLGEGMLEEARRLLAAGVTLERMMQLGLEYRYLALHLSGSMDYDSMVAELYLQICRFAKRQMTWFRGMQRRGIAITWIEGNETAGALDLAADFLTS